MSKIGYHKNKIIKGVIGEIGKIQEELDELKDAEEQNCKIMQLVELSDLIGSIELYLNANFPDMTIEDLITMSRITQRAFKNGYR